MSVRSRVLSLPAGMGSDRVRAGAATLVLLAAWHASLAFAAGPSGNLGGASLSAQSGEEPPAAADRAKASKQHISKLIRQLGNPRYTTRRAAANELRQIGAEAYDLLYQATDDADPEIAASADYLLHEINIRWATGDDSTLAAQYLANYGDQSEDRRQISIQGLARLPNGEGIPGLCRIARFDRSEMLSREAALELIRPDRQERIGIGSPADEVAEAIDADVEELNESEDVSPDSAKSVGTPPSAIPDVIDRELGESTRTAARWLRQYRAQLRDPSAAVVDWPALVDQEQQLLSQSSSKTHPAIVLGLMWNLADLHRRLGHDDQMQAMVDRMVALDLNDSEGTTIRLLQWLVDERSWAALDVFLDKYQDRLARAKRSLYVAALARSKQGKTDLAETLAEKAAGLHSTESLESVDIAFDLARQEQFDWSIREYRSVIDLKKLDSHEAILARVLLSQMLHDHERFDEAAAVLEPLVLGFADEASNLGQLYQQIQNFHARNGRLDLPERESLNTRYHFYRACRHHQQKDWEQERAELEEAIGHDETDADVVIAMYRLPEADDKWRDAVRERIVNLTKRFQQDIDENPSLPNAYNQWAWLVSNTEGDYQKAVEYSRRSLELMPNEPSLLDTLGRCYYAAGDYENAVKFQRRAVARQSSLKVMHRQLALFEKALAEQGASSSRENTKSTEKGK